MVQSHVAWLPETEADRELVLEELRNILASHQFRNSKRYPSLLEHLVRKTVDGRHDELKERALGIDVFGRSPDYDTNADPIVRVTAGEVRRRIAQYYHEMPGPTPLQIEMPLGSYAPEFRRTELPIDLARSVEPAEPLPRPPVAEPHTPLLEIESAAPRFRGRLLIFILGLLVGAGLLGATRFYPAHRPETALWGPVFDTSAPVLLVLPSRRHPDASPDLAAMPPGSTLPPGPYNRISVSDAVSLSRIATLVGSFGHQLDMREADSTSLNDLHERPVILMAATNNHWTMRLTERLRFHFIEEGSTVGIVDMKNSAAREWTIDYARPYAEAKRDYALIARYHDPTTGGWVMIVAGIGAHGTQAAAVFTANPANLEQLRKLAPRGWEKKNVAMVIETDIINGDAGPAQLKAVEVW